MKRFLKIFGITLGSIAGLTVIAALVAVYIVFTPKRLTPIVRNIADKYVSCQHEVGDVELTFFSTFPEFGLRIGGLYIVNPMEGAQSDTLLAVPDVVAKVDVKEYLNNNSLNVHELSLNDAVANIFINEAGETNFDVLVLEEDTTEDTTAFALPFDMLNVDELKLNAPVLTFVDKKDSISASLRNTRLKASAKSMEDIDLSLSMEETSAVIGEEQYADNLSLRLNSNHTDVNLDSMRFNLPDVNLSVNEFDMSLQGKVAIPEDDILIDAHLSTGKWDIPALLQLLPKSVTSTLDGITIDAATAQLEADVKGIYNDSRMPTIDANLTLQDGKAAYMEVFPYKLSDIQLTADAHIDLNKDSRKQSAATVKRLYAKTGKTTVDAKGNITELLDDALCDVSAKINANLAEFKRYLETEGKQTDLQGTASGNAAAKIRLSALSKMQLQKGLVTGNISLVGLNVVYDSMLVDIPKATLSLRIPNAKPQKKTANWANITLKPEAVNFEMVDYMKAELASSVINLETSNILSNDKMLYANLGLQTEHLSVKMDSMGGEIKQPNLQAYVEYDTKATDYVPSVETTLRLGSLNGFYSDIKAELQNSDITASLSGTKKDKAQPQASVTLKTKGLKASMGDSIKAETGRLRIAANAHRNPKKENLLLQWNPRLTVDLNDGQAELAALPEKVLLPQLTFDYSNKVFNISQSQIELGNSDFSLTGELRNIGKWLDKKGNLEGELTFTSKHTDVNELMALVSDDSGTEETAEEAKQTASKDDANPFLVPKDVDVSLVTNIREAVVFDQLARNLGGKLYIKDGVLILEEMGFICNAAKLQLTAMYKTPRRNHIYVGLDYHMTDINIQELVGMIPQIDTMLPMLRSFRGAAQFHLAAETYTNAKYELKPSTIRGACSIEGKDLVLLDSETFGQIAKILMFNKKTENKVDSVSAQITAYKDELNIYPFCITLDKYMAAVGGHHNLDMSFDYHISLLKPLYIGADVKGTFDDLKIRLAKCRYAQDFRPIIHKDVETQNASLKRMIATALKRNVKTDSETNK